MDVADITGNKNVRSKSEFCNLPNLEDSVLMRSLDVLVEIKRSFL